MRQPQNQIRLISLSLIAGIWLLAILFATPATAAHGKARPGPLCMPVAALLDNQLPADATDATLPATSQSTSPNTTQPKHDVCVAAHVYQVIQLSDGTRFLDVCPSSIPDADCRFILLSMPADREEVGDLRRLSGADIKLRGTLRPMNGRFGIYLTHARQLEGGPEKFRPNPRLLRDFDPESDRLAVQDPNLRSSGHRRNFMNKTLKEPTTH